jgi:gluconolactonase
MPSANFLPEVLETTEAEGLATGFIFTEGPTWHPDGYWYFVDLRQNKLFRLTPGKAPELVRTTTAGTVRLSICRAAWLCAKAMTGASRA